MKKIEVVKANEVEVKPFSLDFFTQDEVQQSMVKKITKKELRHLADRLGLTHDEAQIVFAKKLCSAYLLGK